MRTGSNFSLSYDLPENPTHQSNWRYCTKCQSMFFNGLVGKGHCPAGGAHVADGYTFTLSHDVVATQQAQAEWRYCKNCALMFYNGLSTKGVCAAHMVPGPRGPVHGGHVADGYKFVLSHDLQPYPTITLKGIVAEGRLVSVTGDGFTPVEPVKIAYDIFAGGGPTTHETGEDDLISDTSGRFVHNIRVNLAGDIAGANVQAIDVGSGAKATASLP